MPEWRVFPEPDDLVTALADALCAEAAAAIRARGVFHLVLAGGSTPLALYQALAGRNVGDAHWHVWYGDERCLPAEHPERNSVMAETAWLSASRIPPENRRPIPAEQGSHEAAALYASWLAAVPDFDVVLLGMGEDGHTASLFPGHDWGSTPDSADVLVVHDAPKPPPERVSLSAARLSRSQQVWFVITGSNKRHAMRRWAWHEALPVAAVQGRQQTVAWVDAAAWPADD
jgi:6-phosphogluconolactonase